MARRWAHVRTDPAGVEATRKHFERMREAHAESLARMRRVLIHAFPARKPEAIVLVDVGRRKITTLVGYGRLHRAVRLRWGFLDEKIPAAWVHRDEPTLYHLMKRAHELGVPLEVVVGSAPGWAVPWARAQRAYVEKEGQGWRTWLVDEQGYAIDEDEVQLARLVGRG